MPELANLGVLAPLDKVMPDFQAYAKRASSRDRLRPTTGRATTTGLPLDTNTRILIYNPAALSTIGASGPPKTFAQLHVDVGCRRRRRATTCTPRAARAAGTCCPWIWSNGGSLTNKTYTKATGFLNGPKSVAAIQMLVDLYKAGEMPGIIVNSNAGLGTYDGINQNKYVATLDGPWMFAIFQAAYPNTQARRAVSFRPGPAGSVSVVGGEDIVMTKSSKHKTAALTFLRYMLGYVGADADGARRPDAGSRPRRQVADARSIPTTPPT